MILKVKVTSFHPKDWQPAGQIESRDNFCLACNSVVFFFMCIACQHLKIKRFHIKLWLLHFKKQMIRQQWTWIPIRQLKLESSSENSSSMKTGLWLSQPWPQHLEQCRGWGRGSVRAGMNEYMSRSCPFKLDTHSRELPLPNYYLFSKAIWDVHLGLCCKFSS
jgi:hypothetical protein